MRCSQLAGNILAPDYATGIFVAHTLKEASKRIYTLDGMYDHSINNWSDNKIIFAPTVIEQNDGPVAVIDEIADYSCKQIVVHDLSSMVDAVRAAKYICVDDFAHVNILQASGIDVGYIKQTQLTDSFEGYIWNQIFALQKPYSMQQIRRLMAVRNIQDAKLLGNVFQNMFPYAQYSPIAHHEFIQQLENEDYIQLFEFITGVKPVYVPSQNMLPKDLILIEKKIGDIWIIDKSLAQYFDDVIYVGKEPVKGVHTQVIYEPGYCKHEGFATSKISVTVNSAREQKLALQGKIGALMASNLKVLESRNSLYSYIKDCVLDQIRATLLGVKSDNIWQEWLLKSGLEYIKILHKAQLLYDTFFEWHDVQIYDSFNLGIDFRTFKNGECVLAKFYWNTPSISAVYAQDYALSQLPSDTKITLIAPGKIIELDKDFSTEKIAHVNGVEIENNVVKDAAIENVKRVYTKEDDLFYWDR